MPAVPKIYQYYPDVPLKELTDLYSVGDNRFPDTPASNGNPAITHRVCMLSYFTRTLMIHDGLPFNNKYVLLLENMANVGSITWGFQLYLNGMEAVTGDFIIPNNPTEFEYDLFFMKGILDSNSLPRFDKLKVTCRIVNGSNTIDLFVFHDLARATNVTGLISESQSLPFAGNPDAYNFISNQLKEYYPDEFLTWNNHPLEIDAKEDEALKKAVLAVIYYNIQNCRSMTQEMSFLFDLNDFSPPGIKKLINDGNTYTGSFKTGFCQVPLHVLSDILPVVTGIPDYAHIDVGNPVYSIIENNQLNTYNDLESEVLLTIPQKLQQMRDRMTANTPQLIKLYHLSIFPKSAIRMAAMLIKYLFESSKKNSCKECLKKDVRWSTSSLDSLKDYPTFLSNILTHYYREPYNKIDEFAPEAIKSTKLTFSPYIYSLIHNVAPRILRAYFASRKVTKTATGEYWMEFERIGNNMLVDANGIMVNEQNVQLVNAQNQPQAKPAWDSFLGREFLLVVETWGFKDEDITCRLHPSDNLFTVGLNGGNLQVQADGNFVTDIQKRTGLLNSLNINTNALPGTAYTAEYLRVNHSGKTIVKIRLRPQTAADFATWTNNLGINPLTLGIVVQRSDNTACLFGSDTSQTRASEEFLTATDRYDNSSRFRIANRRVYEIHHRDNPWNNLPQPGANRLRIGKIENTFITAIQNATANSAAKKTTYFYYDSLGHEHFICDTLFLQGRPKHRIAYNAAIVTGAALVPPSISYAANRTAGEEIDAITMFFYENGTYVQGNSSYATNNEVVAKRRWYENTSQVYTEELASLDIEQNPYMGPNDTPGLYYSNNNLVVAINYDNTRRRYARPDLFAGVIGALAQQYYRNNALRIICQGFAYQDGSCYPSAEHVDGQAMDVNYLATQAQSQAFINDLFDYGFRLFRVGHGMVYTHGTPDAAPTPPATTTLHTGHLHITNFDTTAANVADLITP